MGIYLPNMEKMPQKGQMLVIFPDGTSYVCFNGMRERLTQTTAVPVPPHGRLGDLDALAESVATPGIFPPVVSSEVVAFLRKAPTIIPAEEVE